MLRRRKGRGGVLEYGISNTEPQVCEMGILNTNRETINHEGHKGSQRVTAKNAKKAQRSLGESKECSKGVQGICLDYCVLLLTAH